MKPTIPNSTHGAVFEPGRARKSTSHFQIRLRAFKTLAFARRNRSDCGRRWWGTSDVLPMNLELELKREEGRKAVSDGETLPTMVGVFEVMVIMDVLDWACCARRWYGNISCEVFCEGFWEKKRDATESVVGSWSWVGSFLRREKKEDRRSAN